MPLRRLDRAMPVRFLHPLLVALVVALGAPAALAQSAQTQGQAVDQIANPPPVVDPRVLSERDRRAYTDTLREARTRIDQKQYDNAIALLDPLIAAHPREPQARFMKGLAQIEAGRRDDALATYRALAADYPELPEPHNNLAVLYGEKGEYDAARAELELAVKAAPDYAVGHENLADVYARLAATHYERAVELDRRNKTAPAKLKLVQEATKNP